MKKFLFLAIAVLGFAACTEKGLENSDQNGELEQSYVAITLAADDMGTRAAGDKYENGTDAEREVKSAYVFFFNDDEPFSVNADGNNYLKVPVNAKGTQPGETNKPAEGPNVSDVKDAVLILEKYKGEYPNKIVAVLNWTPVQPKYALSELKGVVSTLGNDSDGFIMSNSVYANQAKETVDAVALTAANIAKTEEEALNNPVTIFVERVAAKVVFTSNADKYEVGKVDGKTVYAKIEGFELYNDYESSWLIKKIDPATWTDDLLGSKYKWNDYNWFRSYWAKSIEEKFPENVFAWETDNTPVKEWVYCGENTRAWTVANDIRTKVIVKARLVESDGITPVEVVNWWGNDYIGEGTLLDVVANTLATTYFTSTDGVNFVGLTPAQIKCVARNPQDKNAYEVYFVINDDSKSLSWYKYENNTYNTISLETLNKELSAIRPALVYKKGMTYYWTDIKHLGDPKTIGEFGVVRNHVYKVNISGITGYGTPVYKGNTGYIKPEKPVDISSFVSAQINILSWRMVENDYELGK